MPVGAGGANDTSTRLVAQKLSEALGQQFYVENMVGAGGNIAMGAVAKAQADGYTAISVASSFVINPNLYAKVPYDPVKDFAPVSLMCSTATLIAVHPSLPAKHQGAGRAGEGQSRQIHLRLRGHRHARASRRRAVQGRVRARHHACAVHRRQSGDDLDASAATRRLSSRRCRRRRPMSRPAPCGRLR